MNSDYFEVSGGEQLFGKVLIHGAKNAVLPLLAVSVMTDYPVKICDCPNISDVSNMLEVLKALKVKIVKEGREITVLGKAQISEIPFELAKVMRSSMFMLGALLSTLGEVKLHTPGGCKIGARPLDIHFDGLKKMGAQVELFDDYIYCHAKKLKGADIVMKFPSVGATENLIMAGVKAEGETMLIGCAREPEIVSMVKCLRDMGAKIYGEGTSVIKIKGVKELGGTTFEPVFDRIVCGTVLTACSMCGGEVEIINSDKKELACVIDYLENKGDAEIQDLSGALKIKCNSKISPLNIVTGPYPLFPTDLQPQFMARQCFAKGVSLITENIFENRFLHINEYKKMGANIAVDGKTAIIHGKKLGCSKNLTASDLRGGAGLILASLASKGESRIYCPEYIERGYENIDETFTNLGAKINKILHL